MHVQERASGRRNGRGKERARKGEKRKKKRKKEGKLTCNNVYFVDKPLSHLREFNEDIMVKIEGYYFSYKFCSIGNGLTQ